MAQTTELEAQDFTPAYNPIKYWIDSTNKNEDGFSYVFDVYEAGTSNKIAEYRTIPRIGDGFGVIDLSRLLRNYVEPLFTFTGQYSDNTTSLYEYDLKVGEEYAIEYAYTGFTDSSGYVQLTGFSSHSFIVGNQINLTESTPNTNPLLTGLHVVTAVTATTVTIDVLYANLDTPSSIAGYIVYADGRKTITRDITTFSGKQVFNGALPWLSFSGYDDDGYTINANRSILTNFPSGMQITESQDLIFNYYHGSSASTRYAVFTNSNGDRLYKNITTSSVEFMSIPCGINNLGTLVVDTGTAPLIKSDTEYYDFQITDGTFSAITESKRIYVDRRCEIESFEVMFVDRLGSWGSFSFNLKAQQNGTIKRETYRQAIDGSETGGLYTYDSYSQGLKSYSIEAEEEYTLNTNWMSVNENEYFKELMTSPYTLIKIDGTYQSCIVQDNSYEVVRQRGRNLIRKTVKVKLSNNDIING